MVDCYIIGDGALLHLTVGLFVFDLPSIILFQLQLPTPLARSFRRSYALDPQTPLSWHVFLIAAILSEGVYISFNLAN